MVEPISAAAGAAVAAWGLIRLKDRIAAKRAERRALEEKKARRSARTANGNRTRAARRRELLLSKANEIRDEVNLPPIGDTAAG